ncbi:hypothetical protein LQ772_09660 [Frateuria edaphi]|uniref:hypothetical protein n=1 Tax=Frateuria edaphi TaxID=2898793 RepID=UPI001E45B42F|nr:hypothetical protein [Frateuria edaphi]UGB44272.1 hypothetical protein LQ772_09660 [Frateuria edaphi]
MLLRSALPCFVLMALAPAAMGADARAIDPALAGRYFKEAAQLCHADGGRLWGKSLCGPTLLVDPVTRQVVANQADAEGRLRAEGGVYVGQLPPDQAIANTAVAWAGVRWTEMLWPLKEDAALRHTVMAHEAFHRIQDSLGLPLAGRDSPHMDTLEGRYTVQLEWRALDAALAAKTDAERRARAADALAFRAARYQKFPEAEQAETALERNEGLAEYTGVMVGNRTPAEQVAMAHWDLTWHPNNDSTFARSFAYPSGPAYGILLDRYRPGWRKAIVKGGSPARMLAEALHVDMRATPDVGKLAARYGGPALLASEHARAEARARQAAKYTAQLVTGPVLKLPLKHMKVQFNPSNLMPLGDAGTVYPTMQVIDDWGSITVDGGALMAPDWTLLTVAAPAGDATSGTLRGQGWTMKPAPGWHVVPAGRTGDRTIAKGDDR